MADERSFNLYPTSKVIDLAIAVDKSSLATANQITIGDLFLDRVRKTQSSTSSSTTVSFANVEQVTLTISGVSASTLTIALDDLENEGRYVLKIIKDTAKTISFTGINSVNYGAMYTPTALYYEIIVVGGYVAVNRIDNNVSGSISSYGFSGTGLTAFTRFDYKISGNVCEVMLKFTIDAIGSDTLTYTFSGFNYTLAYAENPLICCIGDYLDINNSAIVNGCVLTAGTITILFESNQLFISPTDIVIKGSFIIK